MSEDCTVLKTNITSLVNENPQEADEKESDKDISNKAGMEYYKTKPGKDLSIVSRFFRNRMKLMRQTIDRVYPDLEKEYRRDLSKMEEVISNFKKNENDQNHIDYDKILHILKTTNIQFVNVFLKGMFLNVFSELDTFTGHFLYRLFLLKPEVINGNQKQFNASEVFRCKSIDDFREKVIQKEIEAIKRESYVDQISILEKLFHINTLKDFENWGKYVEITQRRNIIAHCDGIITEQYYNTCIKNKCNIYGKVGEKLNVDYEYLIKAISIIEEVSIKLVQVLWRKCFKKKECQNDFDDILNEYIYYLLIDERWDVAIELGKFACNVIKAATEELKIIFLINYCIALNNMNKKEETIKLLNDVDFSAIHREFLLAKYVLLEDINNVVNLMIEIGDKGNYFNKSTYAVFPLFKHIRQNEEFKLTYKKIFGVDLNKEKIKQKIKENEEENPNSIN